MNLLTPLTRSAKPPLVVGTISTSMKRVNVLAAGLPCHANGSKRHSRAFLSSACCTVALVASVGAPITLASRTRPSPSVVNSTRLVNVGGGAAAGFAAMDGIAAMPSRSNRTGAKACKGLDMGWGHRN